MLVRARPGALRMNGIVQAIIVNQLLDLLRDCVISEERKPKKQTVSAIRKTERSRPFRPSAPASGAGRPKEDVMFCRFSPPREGARKLKKDIKEKRGHYENNTRRHSKSLAPQANAIRQEVKH